MSQDTPNKVAMITGAGSGIGKAVALSLLNNHFSVVLTGRRIDKLQAVAELSGAAKERVLCMAADVTKEDEVEALFAACEGYFGRLDVLFNNAGVAAPAVSIDELAIADWQRVIDCNLHGAFLCARKAFAQMRKQQPMGGRIINNGSISAHVPRPNSTPYTVSKHAISGLTRCLALDGRAYDIACGQIDIGNAHTAMAEPLGDATLQANGDIIGEPLMDVAHVTSSVLHMAQLPLSANVLFMNVMASKMPFVGRG